MSEEKEIAKETVKETIAQMEVESPTELRKATCPFAQKIHELGMVKEQLDGMKRMLWAVVIMLCGTLISLSFHNPSFYTFIRDVLFNG